MKVTVQRYRDGYAACFYEGSRRLGRRQLRAATAEDAAVEAARAKLASFDRKPSLFLYVIQIDNADGFIKIGVAANPGARLAELQVAVPYQCRLLKVADGGRKLEKDLHIAFRSDRIRGEWFRPTPDLMKVIDWLTPAEWNQPKRQTVSVRCLEPPARLGEHSAFSETQGSDEPAEPRGMVSAARRNAN